MAKPAARPAPKPASQVKPLASAPVKAPAARARLLNRNRPHGIVYGFSGAHYEQDGILFGVDGREVVALAQASPEDDQVAVPVAGEPEPQVAASVSKNETQNYANLPDKHLQALVEVYGEVFTDRDSAIAFLSNQENGDA
jgi:hypothetical protein